MQWLLPLVVATSIGIAFIYLEQHQLPKSERAAMLRSIDAGLYKDNEQFVDKLSRFDEINQLVDSTVNDKSLSNEVLLKRITEIGLPQMDQAATVMAGTEKLEISPASHKKAAGLLEYIDIRKAEMLLMQQLIETNNEAEILPKLKANRAKANALFQELLKL